MSATKKAAKKRGRQPTKPTPRYSDYRILKARSEKEMEQQVLENIDIGWEPIGGPFPITGQYGQAIGKVG